MNQTEQGYLVRFETLARAKGQAKRLISIDLAVDLDFVSDHVQSEVEAIIIGLLKTFGCDVVKPNQAIVGSLTRGDIERVQKIQAVDVVLKQRIRSAITGRTFCQYNGPASTEKQCYPAVEGQIARQ